MPLTEIAFGVPSAGGIGVVPAALLQYVVVVPVFVVWTAGEVISTVPGEQTAGGFAITNVGAVLTVIVPIAVTAAQGAGPDVVTV